MARHRLQSSNQRGHWLCIAYAFPPINRSGTHRTLGFVRHLDTLGWDATVLTVDPKDESTDAALNELIPESTRVIRTGWTDLISCVKRWLPWTDRAEANSSRTTQTEPRVTRRARSRAQRLRQLIREWGSRLLVTPDSRIGWIVPGVRAALRSIRQRRPDVIYSTSPYMSAHLIAMIASVWTHIPWVADFRDPWRGNPFRQLGFRSLDVWDAVLEWLVLRLATHVVCNTPTMRKALIRRRPFVDEKSSTILNGFDGSEHLPFSSSATPLSSPLSKGGKRGVERHTKKGLVIGTTGEAEPKTKSSGEFVLLHCGQFYGPRSPKSWLAALRRAIELDPFTTKSLRMEFVGPETYDGVPLLAFAEAEGVVGRVRITGSCAHAKAIARMQRADALILAGSSGTSADLQIPNKLFEYLHIRKPILATAGADSPVVPILTEAGAQALICTPNDINAMARAIIRMVDRGAQRPGGVREVWGAWSGVDRFERRHRAQELVELFHELTGVAGAPRRVLSSAEAAAGDLCSMRQSDLQEPALPVSLR